MKNHTIKLNKKFIGGSQLVNTKSSLMSRRVPRQQVSKKNETGPPSLKGMLKKVNPISKGPTSTIGPDAEPELATRIGVLPPVSELATRPEPLPIPVTVKVQPVPEPYTPLVSTKTVIPEKNTRNSSTFKSFVKSVSRTPSIVGPINQSRSNEIIAGKVQLIPTGVLGIKNREGNEKITQEYLKNHIITDLAGNKSFNFKDGNNFQELIDSVEGVSKAIYIYIRDNYHIAGRPDDKRIKSIDTGNKSIVYLGIYENNDTSKEPLTIFHLFTPNFNTDEPQYNDQTETNYSQKTPNEVINILTKKYKELFNFYKAVSTDNPGKTLSFGPISGQNYAGPHAIGKTGKIVEFTVKAIQKAMSEFLDESKTENTSNLKFELCLYTNEEYSLYLNETKKQNEEKNKLVVKEPALREGVTQKTVTRKIVKVEQKPVAGQPPLIEGSLTEKGILTNLTRIGNSATEIKSLIPTKDKGPLIDDIKILSINATKLQELTEKLKEHWSKIKSIETEQANQSLTPEELNAAKIVVPLSGPKTEANQSLTPEELNPTLTPEELNPTLTPEELNAAKLLVASSLP